MEKLLTPGAITQILNKEEPVNPVLQIIGFKLMTPEQMSFGDSVEELRYRLMIGDGIKAHQYCVITNQDLVDDIKNGRLEKFSIIRVTRYRTVDCGDGPPENRRRLIYILNLETVKAGSEVGCKLSCQPGQAIAQQQQQPQQQLQQQQQYQQPQQYQTPQKQHQQQPLQSINNDSMITQPQPYPGMQNTIRSPAMPSRLEHQTIGIAELTPYVGKWIVKGRITSKSGIREYNNAKGGGKLFNFSIADKTGEIKVTAFNTDCERVYAYVEPNKVYVLGRASVKSADKRYSTADFEITLNSDSLLEEVKDSSITSDIPLAKFNFISIASLTDTPPNQPVDLIGAILTVNDLATIVSRTKNKELKKRDLTIVDMSRHSISVTLWGDQAETFNGAVGDIFISKATRIGTYGGRSANAGDCIFVNPEIPEVRKIKNWYANLLDSNFTSLTSGVGSAGATDQFKLLSELMDMEQARNNSIVAKSKAYIMSVGKNPVYKCCPTEGCGKKLVDTQNGELKCDKCQQTYTTYKYRYKTDIEIGDLTTSCWITLWDDKAEQMLGMTPDELERKMKMDNKEVYEKIIAKPNFSRCLFTLRARIDAYQGEEKVKLQVVSVMAMKDDKVTTYCRQLIKEIKAFAE